MRTRTTPRGCQLAAILLLCCLTILPTSGFGAVADPEGIRSLFERFCFDCHSGDMPKGDLSLDGLSLSVKGDHSGSQWEKVLDALRRGEMPPEDADQPPDSERQAVIQWIDTQLRESIRTTGPTVTTATTRRLTNFEYQNTMRDLLGFELNLIDNLPEDPVRPYEFNNSPAFMLIGPEQMDRYKENARRAMASAIVDSGQPKVHRTERGWKPLDPPERGMQYDEIGIYGNRRNSAAWGMGLRSWPETGQYRIRVKAAAILPAGIDEVPLRLVMGQDLNVNSSARRIETVGTVQLGNNVDEPETFEFRGRIENHPALAGRVTSNGPLPPRMTITPQNLYDNGRLNDRLDPLGMPRVVVQSIEFEAPVTDVWPPEHHTRILFESPLRRADEPAYVREVLKRFMTRAYRRPVTSEELDRFLRVYEIFARDVDTFEDAIRETLAMVLISPQFLYHTVAEDGVTTRHYEFASRLSYFLWGSMPDDELIELALQDKLNNASVIDAQVRRMLADERSDDFVDNFTTQWLSLAKMKAVKINTTLFPRFLYLVPAGERRGTEMPYRPTIRDDMHEETIGFVGELIRRNASVLSLVDSDFAYLNQRLAAHYGIEGVHGQELRPVPVKPEQHLGGLLTQGSVLVGNSTGSAPHPIYRAVWLREAILGDEVKDPPAEVPALVDSAGDAAEKAVTIKDLLREHRQVESCNDCHVRLDPWGIPFERYNATGRFQRLVPAEGVRVRGFDNRVDKNLNDYKDYLKTVNTVAVKAAARVPLGPDVDGMQELKAYLLMYRSEEIVKNVLRRLLTYGMGRELTWHDRYAVEDLYQRAEQNDYKLQDMIVAICQSEIFAGDLK